MTDYEQLGKKPLGKTERVTLLDVAESNIERACGLVERALEGMKSGDAGREDVEQVVQWLKLSRAWVKDAMVKIEG